MTPSPAPRPDPAPRTGEATARQDRAGVGLTWEAMAHPFHAASPRALAGGAPTASDYAVYRQMLLDPTLALARMLVHGPVRTTPWAFQAEPDADPRALDLVRRTLQPMRDHLLAEAVRAVDFGWQPFEKIYDRVAGQWILRKLKPLRHELTRVRVDPRTGAYRGLEQGQLELPAEKTWLLVHDPEPGQFYGTPRLENAREPWRWWRAANDAAARYDQKIAGVYPVIHYPPGEGVDAHGHPADNFQLAQRIGAGIQAGRPITVPAESLPTDEPDLARRDARRWIIELLEDRGSRQPGFASRLQYLDALKFRAYLRPERTGLEGSHGTKSEVREQADLAAADAQLLTQQILRSLNWHVVDPLLTLNFGPHARGAVRIVADLD